jgi:hypothetical protein
MAHSPFLFMLAGAFGAFILYRRTALYLVRRQYKKDNGMSTQLASLNVTNGPQVASHARRFSIKTQCWDLM